METIGRRRFVGWMLAGAGAAVAAPAAARVLRRGGRTTAGPTASSRPAPFGQVWVATHRTLTDLAAIDPAIVERFFGPTSFVLGGWGRSIPAMAWASERAFAGDLAADRIAASVRAVMYDPEAWVHTPHAEQLEPSEAIERFATAARRNGYLTIVTPHPGLVTVPGGQAELQPGETTEEGYLRSGVHMTAARFADIVEVQAQYLVPRISEYRAFVVAASAQTRVANPRAVLLSGLSTNFTSDPDVLYEAWSSVREVVDGHYLNVPESIRPEVAVGLLRRIAG